MTGSITNFALLDGLLIDGITKAKWDEANALYQEACALRTQKRWRDALTKIKKAREINEKREEYKTAEEELRYLAENEGGGEAGKLANEAVAAYESGDYETAVRKMEASLKLNDAATNRLLLAQFKERLAQEKKRPEAERLAGLARTALESGDYETALTRINESLAVLAPESGLQDDAENSEAEDATSTAPATKLRGTSLLLCGSAGTSYFDALLHDAQGRLSRVSDKRAKLAIAMANSGDDSNRAALALDEALETRQETLEKLIKLLESLSVAYQTKLN